MWRQMRGGKAAYPRLSQEETAHILAFLYEAGSLDRPGNPEAGRRVFEEEGRARCHAVQSSGGSKAPIFPRSPPPAAPRQGPARCGISRELGKWPEFTGGQMRDLIAFASAGAPAADREPSPRGNVRRGWQVFQKDRPQCHSVRGQGGDMGPSVEPENDLPLSPARLSGDERGCAACHGPKMQARAEEAGMP